MKTINRTLTLIIATFLVISGQVVAQEYDDMYFTPKDRKAKKKLMATNSEDLIVENIQTNFKDVDPNESFSQKNVNPEYISRYSADEYEKNNGYDEDEYYVEDDYSATDAYINNANYAVRDYRGNYSYFNDYSDIFWSDPFYY
ncbi:MAG: hypothetical protein RLO12_13360, partial [Fulvivirga sp.]